MPNGSRVPAWADPTNPTGVSGRFRAARWRRMLQTFPDLAELRVLDLGGTVAAWDAAPVRPAQLVVVNLDRQPTAPHTRSMVLDACEWEPTDDIDLVVSNSLIEHVGGFERRRRLAHVVRAAAPRYWVQTPYRYFPVEPHWVFPGFQFLPLSAKVFVTRHWRRGHIYEADPDRALQECLMVELVSATEMRALFPDGEVWFERAAGLPKSLVAVRT
ncbi:MAG: hypothetical protein U0R64_01360 [Candidatus Nanopelagicales bacterium]